MIQIEKSRVPYFSVIMPTYNRSKLIMRAVNSVIDQTEIDWELIIVDDGSRDNTFELIKPIADKDKRIRYIYQSNRGQALAKNAGILASAGLFITFLDSDDEYKPEHLEYRRRVMQDYDEVELLHGGVEVIGNEYVADMNDPSKLIQLDECIIGGTFVFKRSSIFRLNGFRPLRYGEDTDLYNRAKELKMQVAKMSQKTYIYHRDHSDSLCDSCYSPDSETIIDET